MTNELKPLVKTVSRVITYIGEEASVDKLLKQSLAPGDHNFITNGKRIIVKVEETNRIRHDPTKAQANEVIESLRPDEEG